MSEWEDAPDGGWESAPAPKKDEGGPRPFFAPGQTVGKTARAVGSALAGALLEAPATMATGAIASTLGGIGGAARTAYGLATGEPLETAAGKGADVVRGAQRMTYEPRTQMGQYTTQMLGAPFAAASEGLGKLAEVGAPPEGRPGLRTMAEAAPEAAGAVLGAKGLRKMGKTYGTPAPLTQEQRAIQTSQQAGYLAPPAKANPNMLNQIVESLAGEYTDKKLALKNQQVTNSKAREALGLPATADLDAASLDAYRAGQGQRYEAIKNYQYPFRPDQQFISEIMDLDKSFRAVRENFPELARSGEIDRISANLLNPRSQAHPGMFDARGVIDISKQFRSDANTLFRKDRMGNASPEEVARAHALRAAADSLEGLLERELNTMGQGRLATEFKDARQAIAMAHDVEAATNLTTGNVDAQVLRRLLDKGKPLTGQLREIAEAARTMPSVVRRTEALTPSAGLTTSDIGQAGLLAKVAKGGKYALLAGIRPAASAIATSRPYQILAAQPQGKRSMGPVPMGAAAAGAGAVQPERTPFKMSEEEAQ